MRKLLLGVFLLWVSLAPFAFGQLTSLNGTVTDPTGAVIPNATITIVNTKTGIQREATSDAQGRYSMPQVNPGTYKLTAKSTGFAEVSMNEIELLVNQPATIPLAFEKLGSTSTTVSVEAVGVQVNTTDASIGNAITANAIMELPFYGRNVVDLLLVSAGRNHGWKRQRRQDRSGQRHARRRGREQSEHARRIHQRAARDPRFGPGIPHHHDQRQCGAGPDLGRPGGADHEERHQRAARVAVRIPARHRDCGELITFKNASSLPKPALLINIFGGSVGGPIKKNKIFYFGNYEGRRDASASTPTILAPCPPTSCGPAFCNTRTPPEASRNWMPPESSNSTPPTSASTKRRWTSSANTRTATTTRVGDGLNFIGYRFNAPTKARQNTYVAKFDWAIDNSGKHLIFWRGQLQNDWSNGLPQYPGQAPASVDLNNSKGYAVGYTASIKRNLISTFRMGLTRYGAETTGVLTSGYTSFRNLSTLYPTTTGTARIIPTHTFTEDLNWIHGAHEVKFGAVARFISNGSTSYTNSFSTATTNVSWLLGTGGDLLPPGLLSSNRTAFTDALPQRSASSPRAPPSTTTWWMAACWARALPCSASSRTRSMSGMSRTPGASPAAYRDRGNPPLADAADL